MSTVNGNGECPQCAYESAYYVTDTATLEMDVDCLVCGYGERWSRVIDRQTGTNNGCIHFKMRKDGYPIIRHQVWKGYGSYCLFIRSDGRPQVGMLRKPVRERRIAWFKDKLKDPNVDADRSYFLVWDEETQQTRCVVGTFYDVVRVGPSLYGVDPQKT